MKGACTNKTVSVVRGLTPTIQPLIPSLCTQHTHTKKGFGNLLPLLFKARVSLSSRMLSVFTRRWHGCSALTMMKCVWHGGIIGSCSHMNLPGACFMPEDMCLSGIKDHLKDYLCPLRIDAPCMP